ncbi:MAG: hypothetical protein ACLTW9_08975 [Enterocloster sp.]
MNGDEVEKNAAPPSGLKSCVIFCIRFLTPILVAGKVTLTGFASIYSIVRG